MTTPIDTDLMEHNSYTKRHITDKHTGVIPPLPYLLILWLRLWVSQSAVQGAIDVLGLGVGGLLHSLVDLFLTHAQTVQLAMEETKRERRINQAKYHPSSENPLQVNYM